MDIELLKWEKAKPFLVATAVFYMCLLANTKALQSVNVETVIVVRSCSPIAVTILEHLTLGRELPSLKGLAALLSIAGGAAVYVLADKGFQVQGYIWVSVYFVFIVIEMVYVKFVVDSVPMSTWTRVYYNNTLSLPMAVVSTLVLGDSKFLQHQWDLATVVSIGLSCVVGVAISYAGFNLRKSVSATSFTVVGVVCKLLTVLVNDLMWSLHANMAGHFGLLMCICAGFWFERCKAEERALRDQAKSPKPRGLLAL
jgi:GDP-mannose transporter